VRDREAIAPGHAVGSSKDFEPHLVTPLTDVTFVLRHHCVRRREAGLALGGVATDVRHLQIYFFHSSGQGRRKYYEAIRLLVTQGSGTDLNAVSLHLRIWPILYLLACLLDMFLLISHF
jgi:hypothetical protein